MRSSFGIYVFLLGYVHVYGQRCPFNSVGHTVYGPDCKYRCHCENDSEQCDDTTGSCVSGCANEWMGPGCQYRDILWRKEASQLESSDAYKVVDGKMDTCSSSMKRDGPLWWRAWFGHAEMIRGLIIVTEDTEKGHFSKFKVYVENSNKRTDDAGFQLQETCYEHDGMSPVTTTMSITCVRPMKGNQVRIQLASEETWLVLCDVRMFGGRNLAYSKYTHQSSTLYGYYNSSKAVDGAIDGGFACTDEKTPPHTWTVDLGDTVRVQALQLISTYNFKSTDTIQVGVDNYTYPVQFTPNTDNTSFFTSDVDVRYLQFKRSTNFICLWEVLIYGDCLDYKCGLDCSIPCHCAVFTFESKVSGECLEGCAAGWTGQGRRCDTECPDGTYGLGCSYKCSDNCLSCGLCDKQNGFCETGCKPGWKDNTCRTECNDGTYGLSCSGMCHCVNDDTCNKVNGHCLSGCASGWIGKACDSECDSGRYGPDCLQTCFGHCLNNVKCDNVRGHCPQGCAAGWIGEKCDTACAPGTFGINCSQACGRCWNDVACNEASGQCPSGCEEGWSGGDCKTACAPGTFGINCSQACGRCWNDVACNEASGQCPSGCEEGWSGGDCKTEIGCPVHTFGLDCTPCGPCKNGSCDPVTGECPSGCYDGYVGSMCETFNGMYTVNAVLVGAGVGVVITLLVAAVLVAVLWKIKQRPHIYEEPLAMTSSGPINEPDYDTCQDQGRQNENANGQEHVYMNEM